MVESGCVGTVGSGEGGRDGETCRVCVECAAEAAPGEVRLTAGPSAGCGGSGGAGVVAGVGAAPVRRCGSVGAEAAAVVQRSSCATVEGECAIVLETWAVSADSALVMDSCMVSMR